MPHTKNSCNNFSEERDLFAENARWVQTAKEGPVSQWRDLKDSHGAYTFLWEGTGKSTEAFLLIVNFKMRIKTVG